MRHRRLLLLAVIPLGTLVVTHGCSGEPPFSSVCAWVSNPDNCFRAFREDMLTSPSQDCSYPGSPTEATPSDLGTPNGTLQFGQGSPLTALCVITSGGAIAIDPPINVTAWPPDPTLGPVTYTLTLNDPAGNACGVATYTSPHGFSITINAPPAAPTDGGAADAGIGASAYGTFAQSNSPGRDAFDVVCPDGETYHFNLDEALETGLPDSGTVSAFLAFRRLYPRRG